MKTDVSKDVIPNNHSFKPISYLLNKHMLIRKYGAKIQQKTKKTSIKH